MPSTVGKRAIVIGAGIGGLTAARAVAPYFEHVIIIERDALPAEPSDRAGTPQAKPDDDTDHKLSGGALAALLLATGGAVAAIIFAVRDKQDLNFGGTVVVVSPTK